MKPITWLRTLATGERRKSPCAAPPTPWRRSDDRAAVSVDFASNRDTGDLGFTPGHVYTPNVCPPEDPTGPLSASYRFIGAKSYSDHKQLRHWYDQIS
jgi:hypothetical protein